MPRSMCHADGSICKTDKAQLAKLLEKKMNNKVNQQPSWSYYDISMIDGFFILYLMKDEPEISMEYRNSSSI